VGVAGAAGPVAGGFGADAVLLELAHANHPNASAATKSARVVFIVCDLPAFHACVRFRSPDRRTHPMRI
jgi:hypothetical protein